MKGKINLQFGPSDEGEVGNPGHWFHFYAFCLVALSVAPASWGFLGIYQKNLGFYSLRCVSLKVRVLTDKNLTRV